MTALVFDNTPLSHFARAGALPVLEAITSGFRCVASAEVIQELISGVSKHPALAAAVSLPWIEIAELSDAGEIVAFRRDSGQPPVRRTVGAPDGRQDHRVEGIRSVGGRRRVRCRCERGGSATPYGRMN